MNTLEKGSGFGNTVWMRENGAKVVTSMLDVQINII